MASLTETAYITRKGLKVSLILLVILLFGRVTYKTGVNVWRKLHPPPPPPPTVSFGKLPQIVFPEKEKTQLSFTLETIQGSLPQLPDVGKIYFMPLRGANLLSLERASILAKKMGFNSQPEKITDINYRWTVSEPLITTLEINIHTGNFHLLSEYNNDEEISSGKNFPSNQQAAQEAKSFLTNNDLLSDDLANGTAEFEYLRWENQLQSVASLSEAQFIRVNLYQADMESLKILPPETKKSLVSFLFTGARTTGKRIVEINYAYFPVDKDNFATYPLKPVSQAWDELQAGKGYPAWLGQNTEGKVVIRQVNLAYYDSSGPQNFLQPIYVFSGDRNFYAYISALDPKWQE